MEQFPIGVYQIIITSFLLNDLVIRYGMSFIPTQKSTLEVMLNKVRILLKEGRIIIDPKCEFLIGNLKFGVWAKTKRVWKKYKI